MIDFNDKLEVGTVICFVTGKKEKPVSYTSSGKVILCRYNIPLGYAEIKTVEDKGNYYLVTAVHIIKDLYPGINYEDFVKVVPLFGYKIGFDRTFINPHWNNEEHQIFVYNLDNKVCIVAETFTKEGRGSIEFNSIKIYLPGKCIFDLRKNRLVSHGSACLTVLDACYSFSEIGILDYVSGIMNDVKKKKGEIKWPQDESPSLWTYEDKSTDDNGNWILGDTTIQRLRLAPSECLSIFEGCDFLKKLQ